MRFPSNTFQSLEGPYKNSLSAPVDEKIIGQVLNATEQRF